MPQDPRTSFPRTDSRTGIVAYCPTMDVPSRAIQISGSCPGLFGLRRYCHSQRIRLASAASLPKTRRYSPSTDRLSSDLYRVISATLRPCEYVFHVADERVLGQRTVPEPLCQGPGHPANCRGGMQFLADDAQSGVSDLTPETDHPNLFQQVVVFDFSPAGRLDERVLIRRLAKRPRCAPGEPLECGKCNGTSKQQMQRHREFQPW